MNKKTLFCMIVLTALLLSGCTQNNSQGSENTSGTGSSPTDSMSGSTQSTTSGQNMLTEEEARQIALAHANLTVDQVSFTKSEVDREDGRIVYDIEFYTQDNREFDYEIDPYTGEVLDYDQDAETMNDR